MDKPICINCKHCDIPNYYDSVTRTTGPRPEFAKCLHTERKRIDLVTGEVISDWKYCKDNRSISGFCGADGKYFTAKESVNG